LPVHMNYDKLLIKRAQVRERTLDGTREQPNVTVKFAKNTFTTTTAQKVSEHEDKPPKRKEVAAAAVAVAVASAAQPRREPTRSTLLF